MPQLQADELSAHDPAFEGDSKFEWSDISLQVIRSTVQLQRFLLLSAQVECFNPGGLCIAACYSTQLYSAHPRVSQGWH